MGTRLLGAIAAALCACGGGETVDGGTGGGMDAAREDGGLDAAVTTQDAPATRPDVPIAVDCTGLRAPELTRARIERSDGADQYRVALEWMRGTGDDVVVAEAAPRPDASAWVDAMTPVPVVAGAGSANVDKLMTDIFLRLSARRGASCRADGPPVRLAKPDYADPARWGEGWIKVVSHTHTIADIKEDRGEPVHANRINWYNGCFEVEGDDPACHALLLRSFAESGLTWLMDAAADQGIGSVIVTDHDNVGIWYTDVFRRFNVANPRGPSVVAGLEWTSALGHLTVVGNFLPEIPRDASIYDLATARRVHTSVPLPPDRCDDTDENHDVNDPAFDGPDAPCRRADHRGHGDDPPTMEQTRVALEALRARGALVFANHPTNDSFIEPPMSWRLGNLDLLDGVEVNTPDPTATNRNAPEWWRDNGLRMGRRWIGIAGTDCHVDGPPYAGDTGCNRFHGLASLTHMDAPYMWVQPLGSTSRAARNSPDLVVAALREGRVTVVQDLDPAVVVDVGIDVNGDGSLDYWSGSVVPACEQPARDTFDVQVRVRPVQTHNYNVNVWRAGTETRILDRTEIRAGVVWEGTTTFSRSTHIPGGRALGFVTVQVREDMRFSPDDDAGFSNAIFFERADPTATPCDTRDAAGL